MATDIASILADGSAMLGNELSITFEDNWEALMTSLYGISEPGVGCRSRSH